MVRACECERIYYRYLLFGYYLDNKELSQNFTI